MNFPLTLSDISLWLAVTAIIPLITSQLVTSSTGYLKNLPIDKKRLRLTALALGTAFMATVILRIIQPFQQPLPNTHLSPIQITNSQTS